MSVDYDHLAATAVEACLLRPELAPAIRRALDPADVDRPSLRRIYTAAVACAHIDGTEARYRAVAALMPDTEPHHLFTLWRPDGEVRPTAQGVAAAELLADHAARRRLAAELQAAADAVQSGVPRDVVLGRLEVVA